MQAQAIFGWGMIGTGGIARLFAADLERVAGARLAAVCSRSQEAVGRFLAGRDAARGYTDLAAMLGDPAVEAVYIATPNHLHAAQARQVLDAGKPVLVEKPFATGSAEAASVFALAAGRGTFAMEGLWTRFLPAVAEARRLIAAGAIGEPQRVEAELSYARDPALDRRFFDAAMGGGAALDLGVYPLSLTIHLFGEPDAFSGRWTGGPGGVDRRSVFSLRCGSMQARIACGLDADGDNAFTVIGSDGALRLNAPFLKAQKLTLYGKAASRLPLFGAAGGSRGLLGKLAARTPVPGRRIADFSFAGNGLQFEIQETIRAVRAGRTVCDACPPAHTLAVLGIIETVLAQPPAS